LTVGVIRLASGVTICVLLLLVGNVATAPVWPFPAKDGTTWQYTFAREPENDKAVLTRQIVASSKPQKQDASLQVEEKINGAMQAAEILKIENGALLVVAQRAADGKVTVLAPPETLLPAKMGPGISWNFHGEIAGIGLSMPLKIVAEEQIQIPAGKFRAWHVHGEQAGTVATTAEQWWVPGVGLVKESVTQRSPTGHLIGRRTVELTVPPSMEPARAALDTRPFEASVSTSTAGASMDIISADALQIVARWRVRRPAGNAKVRAVWIAEDTGGIVPANYKVDEATAIATPPESVGTFTLSRPSDGWAAGKYRVEFYVQDALAGTARITIAARASTANVAGEF
jgi:hypothetical protein